MNFPSDFDGFLQWANRLSSELGARTHGSVRIGANKLAAAMAATLPGVDAGFNINTLKAVLDSQAGGSVLGAQSTPETEFKQMTAAIIAKCLSDFRVELSQQWCLLSKEDSLYQRLSDDCDLEFYWDRFEDPDDKELLVILQGWPLLPEDVQRAHDGDVYNAQSPSFFRKSFAYIQSRVMGVAYRNYLMSQLEDALDELQSAAGSVGIPKDAADAFQYFVDHAKGQVPL